MIGPRRLSSPEAFAAEERQAMVAAVPVTAARIAVVMFPRKCVVVTIDSNKAEAACLDVSGPGPGYAIIEAVQLCQGSGVYPRLILLPDYGAGSNVQMQDYPSGSMNLGLRREVGQRLCLQHGLEGASRPMAELEIRVSGALES